MSTDKSQPRPEYVRCIQHMIADRRQLTWCGREHWFVEFMFQGIDHAANNALNEGRLLICPECSVAVRKALEGHAWNKEDDA